MTRPVPYPADVRAKGWRFELDHERIEQSDTWALAPSELRPWLLMLWMTAWKQTPCGSLPDEDALIAARIGMPAKTFHKHSAVLRRGWWLAEDGRLYHDTIVERVTEMTKVKDKERARKAAYRQRMDSERVGASGGSPDLSHGTDAGQTGDTHGTDPGRDDTGTGTGTGTYTQVDNPPTDPRAGSGGGESAKPTKAGEVCKAIRLKGIADVNPSHPTLLAYIAQGVPLEVFEAAAQTCIDAKPPKGMAYLLGIVKRQLGEAAAIASGVAMPEKPWDDSKSSIEAKGVELGLGKWNENDLSANREQFDQYTARVRRAVEASLQPA